MSHDDLVLACDRWLESKRVVLWAHRTIDDPAERWDVANWLAREVEGVLGEIAKAAARR